MEVLLYFVSVFRSVTFDIPARNHLFRLSVVRKEVGFSYLIPTKKNSLRTRLAKYFKDSILLRWRVEKQAGHWNGTRYGFRNRASECTSTSLQNQLNEFELLIFLEEFMAGYEDFVSAKNSYNEIEHRVWRQKIITYSLSST